MTVAKLSRLVDAAERGPVTSAWLAEDLRQLGLRPGMLLMVHTSISALGFLAGGPESVLLALRESVGPGGTLVLPAFSWNNSEPSHWSNPPVPESWWQAIRDETPPFDPEHSICEPSLGHLPEIFRCQPGVLRSAHPSGSWCAQGPLAERVTADHQLALGLDDNSPLGRSYELDGWVLSLGCRRTTILHLAESRTQWAQCHRQISGSALLVNGQREWVQYMTVDDSDKDFEDLRQAYMQQARADDYAEGPTGYGVSRLFRIRPLVDFGVGWLDAHREG